MKLFQSLIITLIILGSLGGVTKVEATPIPAWFDPVDFDYSIDLKLGRTDIDGVISPADQTLLHASLGIQPGWEWFAWIEADQSNVMALTSWTGFTPGVPAVRFAGETKLDTDTTSSPLGDFPALGGIVGSEFLYLFVCAIEDPNCLNANFTQPNPDSFLTVFLKYEPSVIPLPPALPLFGTGLSILGFLGWRRRRKVAHLENL